MVECADFVATYSMAALVLLSRVLCVFPSSTLSTVCLSSGYWLVFVFELVLSGRAVDMLNGRGAMRMVRVAMLGRVRVNIVAVAVVDVYLWRKRWACEVCLQMVVKCRVLTSGKHLAHKHQISSTTPERWCMTISPELHVPLTCFRPN